MILITLSFFPSVPLFFFFFSGAPRAPSTIAKEILVILGCLPFTLNHPDEKFTCNGK